jgi:ribosomal protein L11 methyltransferase
MNAHWHLITATVARKAEEVIAVVLFDLGTTGILTLEESRDSLKLGAYFDESFQPDEIAQQIEARLARAGLRHALFAISISRIEDQDWMQKWKEGFEPIEIGRRLVVAPSWKLPEKSADRVVIEISPGQAFGTGTHETTRLCLEAIERHFSGATLLDVGTGTGILAIGAALLVPQSKITAVDRDPLAVEVARENIEINRVSDRVGVVEGTPADFAYGSFDVVVANLTAEVLITLMDELAACMAPSGVAILSGILAELAEDVERRAEAASLAIIERHSLGEWVGLVARAEV